MATGIWSHVGKRVVRPFFFFKRLFSALVLLLFFHFPPTNPHYFPLFPLLSQCDGCLDVPVCGLMAGLQVLLAMGASLYCLGAG